MSGWPSMPSMTCGSLWDKGQRCRGLLAAVRLSEVTTDLHQQCQLVKGKHDLTKYQAASVCALMADERWDGLSFQQCGCAGPAMQRRLGQPSRC